MSEATSMQHLFFSNGKVNIFGWILFTLMIGAFALTMYNCYVSINKITREETVQLKKMSELEMNLRQIMGPSYKDLK